MDNTENIFIAHPINDDQLSALKAIVKALKIKFEIKKTDDSTYNPEFVVKIQESKKDFENGNYTRVKQDDLQNYLGI